MSEQTYTYNTVLVATGGAPHSQPAVRRAAQIARHYGATLHVVTVTAQLGTPLMNAAAAFPGAETFELEARQGQDAVRAQQLREVAETLRRDGLNVVEHLVPALKPADAILQVAQDVGADLIVLGRRHTSAWTAALAGSVSDMVSHASGVDVLIAR